MGELGNENTQLRGMMESTKKEILEEVTGEFYKPQEQNQSFEATMQEGLSQFFQRQEDLRKKEKAIRDKERQIEMKHQLEEAAQEQEKAKLTLDEQMSVHLTTFQQILQAFTTNVSTEYIPNAIILASMT